MRKMLRSMAVTAAATGSVVLALGVSAPPADAKVRLLFCSFITGKHVINRGILVPWTKAITKATEGRVAFRFQSSCRMAPPPLQMVMVQKGTADGAFVFDAFLRKLVPSTQLAIHPQVAETATGRAVAQWRMYEKFFKTKADYKNLHLLGYMGGTDGLWFSMTDKPLISKASMSGVKIWTLPSIPAEALRLSGATIVPGPAVRIYPIVSKGVVDAFVGLSFDDLNAFKIDKYAKSATKLPGGWFGGSFSVFFNKKKWDSIPAKDQAIINGLSGEKFAERSYAWDLRVHNLTAAFLKKRKLYTMPEAEMAKFRKDWAPMYDNWVKIVNGMGVDGKAALAFFKAQAAAVDAATTKRLAAEK